MLTKPTLDIKLNPMNKADILLALIFSLRIKDENIVIRRGAIKNIAVHSAIGRETIPRKKNKLAKTNFSTGKLNKLLLKE